MNIEIKHLWLHKCPKKWNQYTLMALVVTIIILLILAGISIGMLSGDNSIIKQAGNARTQTDIAEEKEILEQATVVAMGKSKYGNVEKQYLDPELNKYSKIDSTEEVDEGIQVTFKSSRIYLIDTYGNVEQMIITDRTGIEVGDYITYTSPTESVTLSTTETGYDSEQILPQKTLFRVLEIKRNGSMILVGSMNESDDKIYFKGALVYNNGVYTLNTKCSDLYKNETKGITARSINIKDIEEFLKDSDDDDTTTIGKEKIKKFIKDNVIGNAGRNIIDFDEDNNTLTYKTNTQYPLLYRKQLSESDNYYSEPTTETNIPDDIKPSKLTVEWTGYVVEISDSDFKNNDFYNIISSLDNYWIASRYTDGNSLMARFGLRYANCTFFSGQYLYTSSNSEKNRNMHVCPIITIPSSVKVTPCTGTNSSSNPHTVVTE